MLQERHAVPRKRAAVTISFAARFPGGIVMAPAVALGTIITTAYRLEKPPPRSHRLICLHISDEISSS